MFWATEILKQHGLKITEARLKTLKVLRAYDSAISHNDLEIELGDNTDRVTLYRILKAFEVKGIIHSIVTQKGGTHYALCNHCTEDKHIHNHIHFRCTACERMFCINNISFNYPNLPVGFFLKEFNLSASGLCQMCSGR